ncbi:MAG TPA: hypothetical protein VMP68_20305 [Candidatus Eisenbacteria bacterium]|nr:hypothetical protein [Candidatus Eisenbacteria bacterium]
MSYSSRHSKRFCFAAIVSFFFLPVLLLAGKSFVKPVAKTAINYPAHDFHRDEKVAIAADPYDNPEKAKLFTINFAQHGFLPVFFIVSNDGDQPVSIANMQITLITGHNSKLTPLATDDLYRRLSNPQAKTSTNNPLPFPRKVKGGVTSEQKDEVESSQFAAKAVEPHGTQSGFLFFDIADLNSPLRGANIDITGVTDAKGNELMFFEIPMDQYLDAPKNP